MQRYKCREDLALPHFLGPVLHTVLQGDGSGLEERPRWPVVQRWRVEP